MGEIPVDASALQQMNIHEQQFARRLQTINTRPVIKIIRKATSSASIDTAISDTTRAQFRSRFAKCFEETKRNNQIGERIEKLLFDTFSTERTKYRDRSCALILNMNPTHAFRKRVLMAFTKNRADDFKRHILEDDARTMAEGTAELEDRYKRIDMVVNELQVTQTADTNTGENRTKLFTCSKCKGNDCSFRQLQTRSGDEPLTTFITCLKCCKRWRQS
jgi:DNA-directed RNA polymerase subunit M/transcription elongation factor TFIIS